VSDELVSLADVPQTVLDISGDPDPKLDGRSLLPFAQNPALRTTRPILLEADTGAGATAGPESASASAARASVARAGLAGKRGVKNLEQEKDPILSMKSASIGNSAPAYKAIRSDRYLYVLYANGQTELYDMLRDPAQLNSLARDPRYRYVRKWLYAQLLRLGTCAGTPCNDGIGIDPAPLKPKPKPKHKKKGNHGKQGKPTPAKS
jgi:arylsulfatase A-like enzyme